MDLIAIKKLAFDILGDTNSHPWKEKGNKYYHGERVASLVLQLRKIILPEDESRDDILTVAAWFHDVMNGQEDHARKGANKTREILSGYCTEKELNSICEIIAVHDDRNTGRDTYSDYIKLQQDADLLDHFGTFDIFNGFLYSVPHNQTILDVLDWIENYRPTEDERYRNELNFNISKKIYDEKSSFVKRFGDRFKVEVTGGIWNLDKIINSIN
jgi:HD superfamily phosphodiesterase